MNETALKDRRARAIAAAIHHALGDAPDDPKRPVLADRRRVAEEAAKAAIASIMPGDTFGDGLVAVRRTPAVEPSVANDDNQTRPR